MNIAPPEKKTTLHVGHSFSQPLLELIPSVGVDRSFNPELPIAIRMDLEHNEQVLTQVLQTGRKVNIVSKTPINLGLLNHFKAQIESLNVEVDETTPAAYITQVKKIVKQHTFFSRTSDDDVLARLRFTFFDVANIERVTYKTRADFETSIREYLNLPDASLDSYLKLGTLKFKAQKYVLSRGKIYLSMAHEKADLPRESPDGDRVLDADEWYRDQTHFLVYTP